MHVFLLANVCMFYCFISNNKILVKFNFEVLAYEIIEEAYHTDDLKAGLLLMTEVSEHGNMTCLQIAKLAGDLKFIGHPCVQELLNKLWFDKLSQENSYKLVSV